MTENGQGPRRARGGEATRHGTRSLAARWRPAPPRQEWPAAARRNGPPSAGDTRGGRGDEGADFVRRAIQDLFQ